MIDARTRQHVRRRLQAQARRDPECDVTHVFVVAYFAAEESSEELICQAFEWASERGASVRPRRGEEHDHLFIGPLTPEQAGDFAEAFSPRDIHVAPYFDVAADYRPPGR